MSSIVSIKGVGKSYTMGRHRLDVLKGIDLEIERGEFVSIMGPSGSGKTTLMNLIGLLDRPDGGDIMINGRDVKGLSDAQLSALRGKEIGFVFQSFNLIPRMDAIRNVEVPMIFQGIPGRVRIERAKKYLGEVGLADRLSHRPGELSGGQRQRVAIARALANDPSILLADEPTGNLDLSTGMEIMQLFAELNRKGRTIVIVTHNPDVAAYSSRAIQIRDGGITGQEFPAGRRNVPASVQKTTGEST